ncbi:lysozyme [Chromohalobacter canadensis]|uniref:lysozyme n=1 Tax=Chromohalobacter canadensis TaxID=141389 RepID=UPI0021C123FD|nr:lysozyme [Chromohalobacter canadensis]MCT8469460.1 lysozyme [Chromohalobacter canadensis]MCT8472084.1 lysozyme [Chromohalobacter canadensis]MCT8499803.1 lysozyme [Chromohalobacter canadensis]
MSLKRRLIVGGTAGALSLATAVVSQFEGYRSEAYRDPVGIPTICYGHTGDVAMGQTLSQAECKELLAEDLGTAFDAVDRHVDIDLSPARRAALASFVYNVGEGKFARSTLLERLNAGKMRAACDELNRWVYAGGRKLAGLVKRRAAERKLCLRGLAP